MSDIERSDHEQSQSGPNSPRQKLPNIVGKFIEDLLQAFNGRETDMVRGIYEEDFEEVSRRFSKASLPPMSMVAEEFPNDAYFIPLYGELYYRHINTKLRPSIEERCESYKNYMKLFTSLLDMDATKPDFELPSQWLWDIVDEFIYQFQSFHQCRSDIKNLNEKDIAYLKQNDDVWSAAAVLRMLHALIKKGKFEAKKTDDEEKEEIVDTEEPVSRYDQFYFLGYYSLIGLSRVNCLMSDFVGSLAVLDPIDIRKSTRKNEKQIVPTATATLYYHVAVSCMMIRRYADAAKHVSNFMNFFGRLKNVPKVFFSQIKRKNERMQGLLVCLCTLFQQRVDESIHHILLQHYQDIMDAFQKGEFGGLKEHFNKVLPKFVSVSRPNYEAAKDETAVIPDPYLIQVGFLEDEINQRQANSKMFEHLKMCTAISVGKLSNFLATDEDTTLSALLSLKHKSKVLRWKYGPLLGGYWSSNSEIDFFVIRDVVHVSEYQPIKRNADYFIRNILKAENMIRNIQQLRETA